MTLDDAQFQEEMLRNAEKTPPGRNALPGGHISPLPTGNPAPTPLHVMDLALPGGASPTP